MTVSCYAISSTKNKTQIKRNAKELFGFEITNAPDMATEIGSSGPAPSAEKKKERRSGGRGHRAHLRRDITRSRERAEAK